MTRPRALSRLSPLAGLLADCLAGIGLALGFIALALALLDASPAPAAPAAPASPVAAPARPAALPALRVVELRKVARAELGSSARIDGRRIAQATRAQLLAALEA